MVLRTAIALWLMIAAVPAVLPQAPSANAGLTQALSAKAAAAPRERVAERIAESKDLLDINTATLAELSALPGMGAEYGRRVVAGRPYSSKSLLVRRGILPEAEYARIRSLVVAHRVVGHPVKQ